MTTARARIVVLDPGFQHVHAHHLNVNIGIAAAASADGRQTVVVASRDLAVDARSACVAAGAAVLAHWCTPGYPPDADHLATGEHERLSEQFAGEMAELLDSGFIRPEDALHLHTGYSFHLEGMARALWRTRARRVGPIVVSMMFHPGQRVDVDGGPPTVLDARELSRHRRALASLADAPVPAIELATSCAAYQRAYRPLWPRREVWLHPSVVYQPRHQGGPAPATGRRRVLLYLGGPKANKGLRFSAAVGARAAPAMPGLEFVFHFNRGFPGAEAFAGDVARLRAAGNAHGNVTVLEGPLDEHVYADTLTRCAAACLFYDPAEYALKTSGVLWDLLDAPNLNFLVSQGTWLADELRELSVPHRPVTFGDEASALAALQQLHDGQPWADEGAAPSAMARHYRQQLLRPYGAWLVARVTETTPRAETEQPGQSETTEPDASAAPLAATRRLRILVVRTHYGHFSPIAGPGGFVAPLREMGHHVDEWLVPLGHEPADKKTPAGRWTLLQSCQAYLKSYQGNAAAFETRLQGMLDDYDVVHFVDGEHCGLLTALARLRQPHRPHPWLVVTFHQPPDVMDGLLPDGSYLAAFDRIQLMAPNQQPWFERHVAADRLRVVPHGLAPELMLDRLPDTVTGGSDPQAVERALAPVAGRKILLCVGSWLRDHEAFLATADLMRDREDCVFVAVAKGLQLDTANRKNVLVLNSGLSDEALHALYRRATLLFLPLKDAAANNAILEAMAHGLPIVTTDLPATKHYAGIDGAFSAPQASAYASTLREVLQAIETRTDLKHPENLRLRAKEMRWRSIARLMEAELYP